MYFYVHPALSPTRAAPETDLKAKRGLASRLSTQAERGATSPVAP